MLAAAVQALQGLKAQPEFISPETCFRSFKTLPFEGSTAGSDDVKVTKICGRKLGYKLRCLSAWVYKEMQSSMDEDL